MSNAAFLCQECSWDDCYITHAVTVATDRTVTVDPVVYVGRDCVREAIRRLEALPEAIGLAQVDPISYAEGLVA